MNRRKRITAIICLSVLGCLFATHLQRWQVYAGTGVTYIATASAHYTNPLTQEVEDPGNNSGIGQSMTESVLYPQALIEKDSEGVMYATVRILLMDQLSDVQFFTQSGSGAEWQSVSATLMQENTGGENCADFRFRIPSQEALVKTSLYVNPMGRAVIFFIDFSQFQEGNTDFAVSIDMEGETPEEVTAEEAETQAGNSAAEQLIENTDGLTTSEDAGAELNVQKEADEAEVQETNAEESAMKPLPWTLVWQCILIITLPALIIGGVLMSVVLIRRRREEEL